MKLFVVAFVLGVLIYPPQNRETFHKIWMQPKDWGLMTLAAVLSTGVITGTFVRWYVLIRALNIPCTLPEAVRLGFLSNLFSFVGMGIVGGDVFKAYVLSHGHAGRRAEVVASVLADRVLGVLGLLFGVSAIALSSGMVYSESPEIRISCRLACIASIGGLLFLAVMPLPLLNPRFNDEQLSKLHWGLRSAILLLRACRLYRHKPGVVLLVLAWSAATHMTLGIVMVLVAAGLGGPTPTIPSQLVIVPLANFSGVLPIPGGLGAFEGAVAILYRATPPLTFAQGVLCALGYRAVMVLVGTIGLGYYLAGKSHVDAEIKAAEQEEAERKMAEREKVPVD